jgi:hypothetical protein
MPCSAALRAVMGCFCSHTRGHFVLHVTDTLIVLQAVGCAADLRNDGKYCMKRRLCREHLKVRNFKELMSI